MNAIAPSVASWVSLWQGALPGFRVDSLYRVEALPAFRNVIRQELRDFWPPPEDQTAMFRALSAPSPDGRFHLIFDRYQEDLGEGPDSAPLLLDFRDSTAVGFEFCGTPCGFHYGSWISPTRFALAGWEEMDATGPWMRGRLWVYSLEDSTSTRYVTRPLTRSEFDRYRSDWFDWVSARVRAG